ncbi:nucleotidyl transferase AbiEii/AbiGii toxin family protein [Idiomarina sp.]|uniref:nucleotidyl transferase AbiEii/AbiGii toxin family protein n=1 Tax=Idiomarina sp. TaxID=1874361 RepID=UPI0025BBCAF6|nr:nucleotidyl transferase AbiEii/AbiGii toxin family protein [Idiomarina sp.]
MPTEHENFTALVERAIQESGGARNRPVIEKELLHYDILVALDRAGLLDEIVFQGGTSLRLCYGSNRYSEDLDFAGGYDFNTKTMAEIKQVLEKYIGGRYGLEVTVKEPNSLKSEPEYTDLRVDKWQVSIVTAPGQKDVPKQRIKLEVSNIPAYTKVPLPLKQNYDFLPDGYRDTLVYVESLDEILADKVISLPATRKYVRHRDIWDLMWLQQEGATIDKDLIESKINDYKIDGFLDMLDARINSIDDIVTGRAFEQEMRRFLSQKAYDRTLGKDKFRAFLTSNLVTLLSSVKKELSGNNRRDTDFIL